MHDLFTVRIQPEQQLTNFQNNTHDTILIETGIINPFGPSKPGMLNKFTLVLSYHVIDTWGFYIHYHNHFTCSQLKTYGSELIKVAVKNENSFMLSYEVEPTEVVYLNQEADPCAEDTEGKGIVNIWPCLEDYMETKVNCTLPWLSDKPPLCTTPFGYKQYINAYAKILHFETHNFTQTANCKPSCKRVEYLVKQFARYPKLHAKTYEYLGKDETFHNALQVDFFFGKDRFTTREQYYTYDFQNLLADFGGYLGLLLGYSLLGFYDTLSGIIKKVFDKCNRKV